MGLAEQWVENCREDDGSMWISDLESGEWFNIPDYKEERYVPLLVEGRTYYRHWVLTRAAVRENHSGPVYVRFD